MVGGRTADADFDTIRDGLERLRSARQMPEVFGAESHEFNLNVRLPDTAVRKFEDKYQIRLPEDYRGFLIHLGNDGSGVRLRSRSEALGRPI